ncbi:MAG: PEP-CTERM sorting domain-containing protein [Okeania sp. SIO3B3]|nr:PEP-CTERM sorting domain-containing protein [Okeania sp. SIO3B3]
MRMNQFLQVVLASLILSLRLAHKLPAKAIVLNSTEDNSSLATQSNSTKSSDLSQFLTTTTSQSGEYSTTDCNNSNGAGTSVPEPTLIAGLVFVTGLGIWSQKKKNASP